MRAAIFNPYFDTLGGGEKYTIFFAKALLEYGYSVDCQWSSKSIKGQLEKRFGIDLDDLEIVSSINRGDGYDICFWVSDGSVPILKARKNFLHFQVPFNKVGGRTIINRMKLFRINKIICNSLFTKSFIDQEYGVNSVVIYPPIDINKIIPLKKENIILYVGRFSELKQVKGHKILIDLFKKNVDRRLKGWRLVLAGGTEVGSEQYFKNIKKTVEKFPIEIVEKPSFEKILRIYGKAKIFWSAAGFGVNEIKQPEQVEHFGISLVEAMAAGAVPIVYNAGGHKEIIEEGKNGFFWKEKKELVRITTKLTCDRELISEISTNARNSSKKYSYENFRRKIEAII